ncbi:hypothetical protein, partial [Herbaspirillum sp. C9C3]|uniref:hypothetical protein n=1 Tax=Herbaspirillum sp. C9C3 TaxID=2735271 RepID=UPI001C2FA4BE
MKLTFIWGVSRKFVIQPEQQSLHGEYRVQTKTPHSFEWGVLFGGADGALLHKRRPRNRLQ